MPLLVPEHLHVGSYNKPLTEYITFGNIVTDKCSVMNKIQDSYGATKEWKNILFIWCNENLVVCAPLKWWEAATHKSLTSVLSLLIYNSNRCEGPHHWSQYWLSQKTWTLFHKT